MFSLGPFLFFYLASLVLSEEYLIVPNNSSCENTTCLTLDQLAQNPLRNGANLTLIFQPGKHTLTRQLSIHKYVDVQIISNYGRYASVISFYGGSTIDLSNINQLRIDGLTFTKGHTDSDLILPTERLSISSNNNLFISNCYFSGLDVSSKIHYWETHGSIVNIQTSMNTIIKNATVEYNKGTALYIAEASTIVIENCTFRGNQGWKGGAVYIVSVHSIVNIGNSIFTNNNASTNSDDLLNDHSGGAIYIKSGDVSINNSSLLRNNAMDSGGGIYVESGDAVIFNSIVTENTAENAGGGIAVVLGNVFITDCMLKDNEAMIGGGIFKLSGNTSVTNSALAGNRGSNGSAIFAESPRVVVINCTSIVHNKGGAALHIQRGSLHLEENNTISKNKMGSIYAFDSQLHFNRPTVMDYNQGESGAAIQATQSTILFNSSVIITHNNATKYGGGIFLRESNLFVAFPVKISHNTASDGGAIYAYQSTIEFNAEYGNMILNNVANNNGGGIHAIASNIKVTGQCLVKGECFVNIQSNTASQNGGGLYFQQNSKLYIDLYHGLYQDDISLIVSHNHALLGGGIYVHDRTSGAGACTSIGFLGECFMQTIKKYHALDNFIPNTYITSNTAIQSGSAIYGGLLDRCTASPNAVVKEVNGLKYIKEITVEYPADAEHSISSDSLQVKLCEGSASKVSVRKGQPFQLRVAALDQVGNPVNGTIHASIVTESGVGRLKEGQLEQNVGSECTELEYNVFSESSSAQVEIYAKGPCNNLGISGLSLTVTFLNCDCPLGFHQSLSNIECSCECDKELHAIECFPNEEMFLLDNSMWIGASNYAECNQSMYLIHDCPFDYCVDQPVNISLNNSQQIDKQCAYNRSGVLCGECKQGLSLVFASSKCKECSNMFVLLLLPFSVAGIALIVIILLLNITIATGTTYGLILYCNILAANKAIFLPFTAPNVLTVFISWINLDIGIETCFYNGMNSQAKVLLQVVFPAYLFFLIFLIIVLSKYINSFAKLLSNRNPVAALCTLLILSYSKLLRLIIAALQFTFLDCSESFYKMVWLYDANVEYLSPSHIPRFVAAAIILTACVLFTTLLFFGQWFPRCSKCKIMKWTKNTKYIGFMDAFHAPFTPKHRYWAGLLLFALIAHNLAASMAPNTSLPVLSAGCVSGGLNIYKLVVSHVYKNRLIDILETFFLLNMSVFALGTYHFMITSDSNGQLALAYVSMAVALVISVAIACYHFHKYVLKRTNVWNNQMQPLTTRRINFNFPRNRNYQRVAEIDDNTNNELPAVADIYNYQQGPREETDSDKYITPPIITPATKPDQLREPDLDILAPITEEDYRQAPPIPPANCPRPVITSTIVEIN